MGNGLGGSPHRHCDATAVQAVDQLFDLPEYNLWRGQVGTVVELLANGEAFEVEFSDRDGRTYESVGLRPSCDGRTYESVGLRPEQIMVLYFDPASPDIKPEMVTA